MTRPSSEPTVSACGSHAWGRPFSPHAGTPPPRPVFECPDRAPLSALSELRVTLRRGSRNSPRRGGREYLVPLPSPDTDLVPAKVFIWGRQASKRDLDHGRPGETGAGALQPVGAWAEDDASFQHAHSPEAAQDPRGGGSRSLRGGSRSLRGRLMIPEGHGPRSMRKRLEIPERAAQDP